jgi:hypothetical protein
MASTKAIVHGCETNIYEISRVSGTVSDKKEKQMNNWHTHTHKYPKEREANMTSWLWKGMLAAAIALSALPGVARADNNDGCSNATLKGEYAFAVTSYTPPGLPNGPPQVVAGIKTFDGKGNLTQRDYRSDSLRTTGQTDFAPEGQETGTYTVNADCTGGAVINLNVPGTPFPHGVIQIVFVISGGGRHIHEVVSEFTPPGFTTPQPTQTSADDWKVGSEQDN